MIDFLNSIVSSANKEFCFLYNSITSFADIFIETRALYMWCLSIQIIIVIIPVEKRKISEEIKDINNIVGEKTKPLENFPTLSSRQKCSVV